MTFAESANTRHLLDRAKITKERARNGLNKLFRDPGGTAPVEGGDQAFG